ncbi:MAG: hypothetical protein FWD05_13780 [Oscillospiraceae bacterium]|nr:hypothetical protein [Oscillospiraceae bacterium]
MLDDSKNFSNKGNIAKRILKTLLIIICSPLLLVLLPVAFVVCASVSLLLFLGSGVYFAGNGIVYLVKKLNVAIQFLTGRAPGTGAISRVKVPSAAGSGKR